MDKTDGEELSMTIRTMQDILNDMKHGLYDFTKDGHCSGCGACCSRYLPVTQKEINQIRRYTSKHHIKQADHGTAVLAKPVHDANCPFLDLTKKEKKCTIYEVRPMICRDFICTGTKPSRELIRADVKTVDFVKEFFDD